MKWELHVHTDEGSICGCVPGAEVVARHKEAGFTGIVITDHFNTETLNRFPGTREDQVRTWLGGYQNACKAGKTLGLTVLFGAEVRLTEASNEYLLFGAEPAFLLAHPTLNELAPAALHALVKQHNILMLQAHPNRLSYCYPMKPEVVDGYEIYNGNPRHDSHNDLSQALAGQTPSLIHTSGSDYHQIDDLGLGSMEFFEEIQTSAQLADCLRRGAFERAHI